MRKTLFIPIAVLLFVLASCQSSQDVNLASQNAPVKSLEIKDSKLGAIFDYYKQDINESKNPYTYIQDKYSSLLLGALGMHDVEEIIKLSFDKKLAIIMSTHEEYNLEDDDKLEPEISDKINWLLTQEMNEINSHHYIKETMELSNKLNGYECEEDEMIINFGESGYSKMDLLKKYEDNDTVIDCLLDEEDYYKYHNIEEISEEKHSSIKKCCRLRATVLWPHGDIKYFYWNDCSPIMGNITTAMNDWEKSCSRIDFVKKSNSNWIKFLWSNGWVYYCRIRYMPKKDRSHSFLGYVPYANVCLENNAKVVDITHEFGHALGLMHEHQRWDRDNYINVYLKKLPIIERCQYYKQDTKHSKSLDFESIMLYHGWYKGDTIMTDKSNNVLDGYRTYNKISTTDANYVNSIY